MIECRPDEAPGPGPVPAGSGRRVGEPPTAAAPGEEPQPLADIPAEQIIHYSPEAIAAWLLARNQQHRARLLAVCRSLRVHSRHRQRAIEGLTAAVTRALSQ